MRDLSEFFMVWLLIAVTPGATAAMIMAQGLRGGMKNAFRGLLGLQTGHFIFLSLLYFGSRFSGNAFAVYLPWVQRLGSLYLIWCGIKFIWLALKSPAIGIPKVESSNSYLQALLTHISNPAALVFTFALLPGYLRADAPLFPQVATLAAIMMPTDFVVMGTYALIASKSGEALRSRRRLLDLAAGLMILWVGGRLFWAGLK